MNSEQYVSGLFSSILGRKLMGYSTCLVQQDGATAHTARLSMNVISETFAGRLIFRNGDISWSPRFPDCGALLRLFYGVPEVKSVPR